MSEGNYWHEDMQMPVTRAFVVSGWRVFLQLCGIVQYEMILVQLVDKATSIHVTSPACLSSVHILCFVFLAGLQFWLMDDDVCLSVRPSVCSPQNLELLCNPSIPSFVVSCFPKLEVASCFPQIEGLTKYISKSKFGQNLSLKSGETLGIASCQVLVNFFQNQTRVIVDRIGQPEIKLCRCMLLLSRNYLPVMTLWVASERLETPVILALIR